MEWSDLPPTELELRAVEIVALRPPRALITVDQAARILRQGRALRCIVQQPDATVVAIEALRDWDLMWRTGYPLLSRDEALCACVGGMLADDMPGWPESYARHRESYVSGIPAHDWHEIVEHTAFYHRELWAIEAAMRAILTAGSVHAGGGA